MLIIRIMQAEVALAGGRLEEAVAALRDPRVRTHRRGQALADRLVPALVARGRVHLAAGRHGDAAADADQALAVGGNQPTAVDLRAGAAAAAQVAARAARDVGLAVAAARRHAAAGPVSAGERRLAPLLAGTPGGLADTHAVTLMDDLSGRREQLGAALRAAEAALAADAVERAAAELAKGRSANVGDARLDDLSARVAAALRRRVADAVGQGKLEVAERLAALPGPDAEGEHLRRAVGLYRVAWDRFDAGRFRESEEALRRAAGVGSNDGSTSHDATPVEPAPPAWATDALAQLRRAADAVDAVRAGPLGWFAANGQTRDYADARLPARPALPPPPLFRPAAPNVAPAVDGNNVAIGSPLPSPVRFLLRVDGVGSFLVLCQSKVALGPISGSRAADLAFVADPTLPPATIERGDDDYFLRPAAGHTAATVNGRPVAGGSRLLADGDKVALSPRVRFTFALPNPASTSAVLHLSGARLPATDVRRVLLMDQDLLIGPGSTAHVRTDGATAAGPDEPTVVLYVEGGRLCCAARGSRDRAPEAEVRVGGRRAGRHAEVPAGAAVRAGGVSFVVTPAGVGGGT